MTDRYYIELHCPYCNVLNEWVFYADEWGENSRCKDCGKMFHIKMEFQAEKLLEEDSQK